MYLDKDLIDDKLYQTIDQFNERKISHKDFYREFQENIHPVYDENNEIVKIFLLATSIRGYSFKVTSIKPFLQTFLYSEI